MLKLKILSAAIAGCVAGTMLYGAERSLKLSSDKNQYFVGDTIILRLTIEGLEMYEKFESTVGHAPVNIGWLSQDNSGANPVQVPCAPFSLEFYVRPETVGRIEYGPFSLEVEGESLISNKLGINILEETGKDIGVELVLSDFSIEVGEWASLKVVLKDERLLDDVIQLKTSDILKVGDLAESRSISYIDGVTMRTKTLEYKIRFLKEGRYQIDESYFLGLSNEIRTTSATITVVDGPGKRLREN